MTAVSGWFDGSSWWLRTFSGGERAVEYASAHESHHRQLHNSTSFGGLARILDELPSDDAKEVARDMKRASARTHEAFASWTPAHALGWQRSELVDVYLEYGTPYDEMQSLVLGVGHPYLALHASHAVARACMQPPVLEVVRSVGLDSLELADFRAALLPDRRFQALLRRGIVWDEPIKHLESRLSDNAEWKEVMSSPKLIASDLRPELANLWEVVNLALYEVVVDHLWSLGLPTVEHDGHIEELNEISRMANRLGARFDLATPRATRGAAAALRNIEAEGFITGDRLEASWRPAGPAAGMIAGIEDPHLFLTLRPLAALAKNYWGVGPDGWPTSATVLRRTISRDSGELLVELMDVTNTFPVNPTESPAPVVTSVAMSLLTSPLAQRFQRYLDARVSSVIVDLPLSSQLDVWLARPGARFRYVVLRTEAQHRVTPVLIAILDGGEAQSHLMLKPLSHAAVGIHRAAFAELDSSGSSIAWDPEVLELHPELLEVTLSHLVGEEVAFGPVW